MIFRCQVELQLVNKILIVYFVRYFKHGTLAESEIRESIEKDFQPG